MPSTVTEEKKKHVHFNIAMPEDLLIKMKEYPEVNWSRVAARAFEKHLQAEEFLQQFAKPDITNEEAARRVIQTSRRILQDKNV